MTKFSKHPRIAHVTPVIALTASGFAAMPAAHAAPATPPTAAIPQTTTNTATTEWWPIYDSALHLEGAGFGHGRGMSQWGAEGAARQGKSVSHILSFYYPNTKLVDVSKSWDRDVRVRLDGWGTFGSSVSYSSAAVTSLVAANKKPLLTAPANSKITIKVTSRGTLSATAQDTTVEVPAGAQITSTANQTTVHFSSGKKASFRGTFTTYISNGKAVPVNTVDMDNYLKSVVPSEVYTSWKPTTLQAQSIAARTYASSWLRRNANNPQYDVCATTRCQMYAGTSKENPKTSAAVDATSRKILTTAGVPIVAEFSSTNGGWRNKAGVNYYGHGADPYDTVAPRHRWSKTVDTAKLSAKWPSIGKPAAINVTKRAEGGPLGGLVAKATIHGSKGQVTVTGDQLRWTLGLYSTRVKASGSGILAHWNSMGGHAGSLGQVISPEYHEGGVQVQRFENGAIVWSLEHGAAAVTGKIGAEAEKRGWEYTGAPLGAQHAIASGVQQNFELGAITIHNNGDVLWTYGRIHEKWQELGEDAVGQPLTQQTSIPGGYSQRFTLGTLVWSDYRQQVRWWPAA